MAESTIRPRSRRPARGRARIETERRELLEQIEEWLELPMLLLGLAWLALLVIELLRGLSPFLERVGLVIWAIFVLDFALRFALAPRKVAYLRANWLTALALLLPALRVFRIARLLRVLRAARAARGVRLFRVVSSMNRGMRALRAAFARRGFGYVAALTLVVTVVGAAGMLGFEGEAPGETGLNSYGEALWWTAMLLTTMGSDYWPRTLEGRALCVLLSLYAFAMFGYVTATLATFFVGRDAAEPPLESAPSAREVEALRREIRDLQGEIRALRQPGESPNAPSRKDAL